LPSKSSEAAFALTPPRDAKIAKHNARRFRIRMLDPLRLITDMISKRSLGCFLACFLFASLVRAAQPTTRESFLKLIDRPRVDPAVQIDTDGSHFSYATSADQRVPGILLKASTDRSSGRQPVVICLHGTGGTKESQLPLMHKLADADIIAVAIDGPHHGARTKAGKGGKEYDDAIVQAWREPGRAHPFYYDTVWDVMRLIDYLQTRNDVNPQRIGLIGISKGGIETYLAAAVDERIAAAAPCIGVQSFKWALDHDMWKPRVGTIQGAFDAIVAEGKIDSPDAAFVQSFYDRVAPGLAGEFDGPAMLPLIAPRPLLVINGDSDNRTPAEGVRQCADAARAAYHAATADDHFLLRLEEHTGHKVTPESEQAAVEWFVRWLRP
jgi:dienelactone hydrolase